jgi:hypothetical protein
MDGETLGALLLVLLGVVLLYPYIFPSLPDLNIHFLHNQSNISPVSRHGESAVYRSKSTSHGRPLLNGLSVRTEGLNPRPGTLADIWQLTEDARIAVATADCGAEDILFGTCLIH